MGTRSETNWASPEFPGANMIGPHFFRSKKMIGPETRFFSQVVSFTILIWASFALRTAQLPRKLGYAFRTVEQLSEQIRRYLSAPELKDVFEQI